MRWERTSSAIASSVTDHLSSASPVSKSNLTSSASKAAQTHKHPGGPIPRQRISRQLESNNLPLQQTQMEMKQASRASASTTTGYRSSATPGSNSSPTSYYSKSVQDPKPRRSSSQTNNQPSVWHKKASSARNKD